MDTIKILRRTAQMSEKEKHKLTNVQIWGFIEKLREEEWYYSEKHEKIPSEKFFELDKKNREKLRKINNF